MTGLKTEVTEATAALSGTRTYVADLDITTGAAHVVFVRSTRAHARISVDLDQVRGQPGVLAAIDETDNPIEPTIAYSAIHPLRFAQPLLAAGVVNHVGEPIAAVVAETQALAIDAAEHAVVEYEDLVAVTDPEVAAADPDRVLRTQVDDGIDLGRDQACFDLADFCVTVESDYPRQLALPIECRAITARWDDADELHVWMATQTPHSYRARIAPMYGVDPRCIHVVAGPAVGGGFGGKGAPGPEEQIVPYLARLVGRAVTWLETRSENLTAAPHGRSERVTVTLAGHANGTLSAIRVHLLKDAGAYPSSGAGLPGKWSGPMTTGPYTIPHAEFTHTTVITNTVPVSALRGAGRAPIISAIERTIDRFAAVAGLDPAAVRLANLVPASAMPYTTPVGSIYDDADYPGALERVLDLADYPTLVAERQAAVAAGGTSRLGIGISCYNHRTCGGGGESALVRVNVDGSATVVTGTTDQGQDHQGTWRIIASAELGIAPEQIQVIEGVTDLIANGVGAIGSRSVQTAGLAIQEASADVVAQAKGAAAAMLEAAEVDIVFDRASIDPGTGELGARFHVAGTPARVLAWPDIAAELARRQEQLACGHVYENQGRDVYPSGTHLAVVRVDIETGAFELVRFVGVDDAGVRINPESVQGQLHGGIALGVAAVLGEAAPYDVHGNPTAATLLDYPALTIDQVCQFELEAQVVASSFNAGGYKAVGESGPIGATAAVHNAVLDALAPLGITHIDLPLTPARVWNAIAGRTVGQRAAS